MREIKLNDVEYLRGKIISASVDEEQLEFKNGVALAKANIVAMQYGQKKAYECYGLIDEEFHEVYGDVKQEDFKAQRNLMFLRYNLSIERFLDNDYIVKVSCGADDDRLWIEYRHIRVENGVPKIINKISEPIKTKVDRLVICSYSGGLCLYDVSMGAVITPYLSSIKENEGGLFDVSIRIKLGSRKDKYDLTDYLFFRIDSNGKIVSSVLSSLENGYLDVSPEESTGKLVEKRKQYIEEREVQFGEELSEFRKCIDTTAKGSAGHVIQMKPVDENNQ